MELSDEEFAKSHKFIKDISSDPNWLLTCLTCTDKNLNPNASLTEAVWVYAGTLGCHTQTKTPPRCTELMIQWLEEMKEANAAVLFEDIPEQCFFLTTRRSIIAEWRRYYVWLQTGQYTINYALFASCDLPSLQAQWRKGTILEVLNATA
jgi:hypothetical protein